MSDLGGDLGTGLGSTLVPGPGGLGPEEPASPGPASAPDLGQEFVGVPGPGMTVSQLSERSGVGVPSIHHYRRLGLLPPPVMVSANRFHYDERHVEALRMIRLLRERRGLPLATIGSILPGLLAGEEQLATDVQTWDSALTLPAGGAVDQDQVRDRLLQTARVAFAARGYGGVNVEQLCQQAGIAKGSFYRHFDSKEAIYVAAARSTVSAVGASISAWHRQLAVDAAVDAVAGALQPILPLLLEVVVRAAHGDPALTDVLPEVVTGIADLVAPHLLPETAGSAGTPGAGAEAGVGGVEAGRAVGAGRAVRPAGTVGAGRVVGSAGTVGAAEPEGADVGGAVRAAAARQVAERSIEIVVRQAMGLEGPR